MSKKMTDAEKRAQTAVVVDRYVTNEKPGAFAAVHVGFDPEDPNFGGGYTKITVGEDTPEAQAEEASRQGIHGLKGLGPDGQRQAFRANMPVANKKLGQLDLVEDADEN